MADRLNSINQLVFYLTDVSALDIIYNDADIYNHLHFIRENIISIILT